MCGYVPSSLHHSYRTNVQREWCISSWENAGLVISTLVLQAFFLYVLDRTSLPITANTGCSVLVSEPSLSQPVSPGSPRGLVLACVPIVRGPSLELESAFPTSTITFSLMLFSVFLWWESYSSLSLKLSSTVV